MTDNQADRPFEVRYDRNLEVEAQLGELLGWTDICRRGNELEGKMPPGWLGSLVGRCGMPKWTESDSQALLMMAEYSLYPSEDDGVILITSRDGTVLHREPFDGSYFNRRAAIRVGLAKAAVIYLRMSHDIRTP